MDAIVQQITIAMLRLPPPDPTIPAGQQDPAYFAVRAGWQQQGQPFQKITDNVTYCRAEEIDDEYNRIRDVSYATTDVNRVPYPGNPPGGYGQGGYGGTDLSTLITIKTTNYTRVWRVFWCCYGPNSFDNARQIRTRLFDQDIHDQFASSQLYLVTDPSAPIRAPEPFGKQWWERVDFSARFNEFVTEEYVEQAAISNEIIVFNQDQDQIADIPLPPENL